MEGDVKAPDRVFVNYFVVLLEGTRQQYSRLGRD